jgi:hypothetical protein
MRGNRIAAFVAIAALAITPLLLGQRAGAAGVQPDGNTCDLTVPAHPFTATGLATPYILSDPEGGAGCTEANTGVSAFVQVTLINTLTHKISVYSPLVVTAGTTPDARPVIPQMVRRTTVAGIWFGDNGVDLHLIGPGAEFCTNGVPGSDFGQYAYCNAPGFFAYANAAIKAKKIVVPPLGVVQNGLSAGTVCPSINSFQIVDQDPNDNVQTQYLINPVSGATAQDNAANRMDLPNDVVLQNPSDNLVLSNYVDPALGCSSWKVPNLANPAGQAVPSLALDQLQAAAFQAAPVGLVENSDEMTLGGGEPGDVPPTAINEDRLKLNLYRVGVDEPVVSRLTSTTASEAMFCTNLFMQLPNFLLLNQALFAGTASLRRVPI